MRFLISQRYLFFHLLVINCSLAFSQSITIIDAFTQRPLEGVVVVSEDEQRFCTSDQNGAFDLGVFTAKDILVFQYMGFKTRKLSQQEIKERNGIVTMFFDEKKLSEIVLSVARTAAQSEKIAERVSVINKTEINKKKPTTGADLLLLAPGVRLQESQAGGGSPVLRGFEANRVLLVVDGVRMNNAIYRSGHLQNAITVDPKSIERVEVVYGSSSVGYGSDALGGVVHYYTKSPRINNTKRLHHSFSSQFNNARNAINYHFQTEASFKKWGSLSSLSYSKFGDVRMGKNRKHGYANWGLVPAYSQNTKSKYYPTPSINTNPNIQKNTGYSQIDFLQKLIFNLPRENQLVINVQLSNSSDIPRFDKLNEIREGSLRFAEWRYGPQKRLLLSPQLKFFPQKNLLYKGTITAAFQAVEESRIRRRFNSLSRETQKESVDVFSLNGDFEMKKKDRSSMAYGFELIKNKIGSIAFAQDLLINNNTFTGLSEKQKIPTRYPSEESSYRSAALYGNYRFDPNTKTSFSFGVRYTNTVLEASWNDLNLIDSFVNPVSLNNSAFTGSVSLSYRPIPSWKFNVLLSSGFRAPNIDDIGKIRENNGYLLVPNPELKPEYVYNFDGGVSFDRPNFPFKANLRFYYTNIQDYIGRFSHTVSSDFTTESDESIVFMEEILLTQTNVNLGSANIYGLSLEAGLRLTSYLNASGNISFTKADEMDYFGPLPSILPYHGKFTLNYHKDKLSFLLRNRFNSAKKVEDYSLGGEDGLEDTPFVIDQNGNSIFAGTPSWTTFDFLSNYDLNEALHLTFAVENIFDLHYRSFASGISAPGRSCIIGLNIHF